jgi:hypothetical protein
MQLNLQSKPNLRLKTGEKKSLSSFNTSDNKSLNPGRGIPWSSIKVSHEYVFNCSYGRRWVILMSLAPDQFQCTKKLNVHAKWFKVTLATYYFFHIQLGRFYIYIYIYIYNLDHT